MRYHNVELHHVEDLLAPESGDGVIDAVHSRMEKRRLMRSSAACRRLIVLMILLVLVGCQANGGKKPLNASNEAAAIERLNVYLAGDSTVANYLPKEAPRAGWGQMIGTMMDDTVTVYNGAASGRSSKSFIDEGKLVPLLEKLGKGDYLLIQFGHNDEKKEDPARYTEPGTTYKSYLKQYIEGARLKGAAPILVTPVERLGFASGGKAKDTHGQYPAAMKALGKERDVPVIDLTARSKALYERLGEEKTKALFLWLKPGESPNYPDGSKDNTHFQEYGATQIAGLVAAGLKELNLSISSHIKEPVHTDK
ncbi:rhamnogalacturonan acetylesterase [Paenibacillus allorhizosphaerae]|uniref:SGNH hydrolase-type esterase domain-containing protein n=1 Tax=Paenibacillus allorhizosphaerae TaxID=2849866 RepID=A0ABN7TJ15_9BACL|nr:rhamnogalacturonan acetylesterase [Paenibacillus allorhizosphaerae]CAG7635530.1 hypothetical protein PAECIP111802_02151 [Paenibacillus allorhizosphaerae]